MKEQLTFIDLFAGCGGFTLGMLRAGFRCLASVDFNSEAIKCLKDNLTAPVNKTLFPVEHCLTRDLTTFAPFELAEIIGASHVDVIVGGPPCQGFSTARQRDGANHGERLKEDPRRSLYKNFLEYINFFQPRVFVMENVLGIRTAAGGHYFTAVQHEARLLGISEGKPGYRVHSQIEDAYALGVPQKRRRQLIIGVRADIPIYFDPRIKPAPRAMVPTNLGDCLIDLPPLIAGEGVNERQYDATLRARAMNRNRQQVQNYLNSVLDISLADSLTNHVARPHSERDLGDFALLRQGENSATALRRNVEFAFPYDRTCFKDRYTRQHLRRPCSTIVAHLSKDGLMFIHPTQNRSLTPREAARIQSFPDWFKFPEPRTHSFRMIGNAVPPLIGEAVGCALKRFFQHKALNVTPSVSPRAHLAYIHAVRTPTVIAAIESVRDTLLQPKHEIRTLSGRDILRRWRAVLLFLPDLHPSNAVDYGEIIEMNLLDQTVFEQLGLRALSSARFMRTGWPIAVKDLGDEMYRRFRAGTISPQAFYCLSAPLAHFHAAHKRHGKIS